MDSTKLYYERRRANVDTSIAAHFSRRLKIHRGNHEGENIFRDTLVSCVHAKIRRCTK